MLELTEQTGQLLAALGHGGTQARRDRHAGGAWPRRAGEAAGRQAAGAARGPLREGRRADPPARPRRADHRPAGLDLPTRTPARSARASSASRTSSGTSPSSARSPRTPSAARAGSSCRPATPLGQPGREHAAARDRRTSSTALGHHAQGDRRSTAASCRPRPTTRSSDLDRRRIHISGRQEPGSRRTRAAAALPHRRRRPDQPPQTRLRPEPHPPQRRRRPCRSGPAGRSSPTTSTPSPSEPAETPPPARSHPGNHHEPDSAAPPRRGRFSPRRLSGASS